MRGGYGDWCISQSHHAHTSQGVLYAARFQDRMVLQMTGTVRAPRTALMRNLPRIRMSMRMSYWGQQWMSPSLGDIQMT